MSEVFFGKTVNTKTTLCLILLFALATDAVSAQTRRYPDRGKRRTFDANVLPPEPVDRSTQTGGRQEYSEIFRALERGILEGNVGAFSAHFGPQVFVSLPGGESGYYSSNQAYYVLQNYLGGRHLQSFRFSTFGESEVAPYATGAGRFESRGTMQTVQVYAAVSRAGGRWMLTQVNIY